MKKLETYLMFNGNCEEALDFYADALGGVIQSKQTYGETDMPSPDEHKNKIMHARFTAGDIFFMAADVMPGQTVSNGGQITLSIHTDSKDEQADMFNKLSVGGTVTMELQDTFWGAKFGMLTDKFDISWMINCPNEA